MHWALGRYFGTQAEAWIFIDTCDKWVFIDTTTSSCWKLPRGWEEAHGFELFLLIMWSMPCTVCFSLYCLFLPNFTTVHLVSFFERVFSKVYQQPLLIFHFSGLDWMMSHQQRSSSSLAAFGQLALRQLGPRRVWRGILGQHPVFQRISWFFLDVWKENFWYNLWHFIGFPLKVLIFMILFQQTRCVLAKKFPLIEFRRSFFQKKTSNLASSPIHLGAPLPRCSFEKSPPHLPGSLNRGLIRWIESTQSLVNQFWESTSKAFVFPGELGNVGENRVVWSILLLGEQDSINFDQKNEVIPVDSTLK